MAMNRCLINVALAIGSCGLLAPLMPGVTAIAQSRRQQPHPGHEHRSGHEHVVSRPQPRSRRETTSRSSVCPKS